MSNFASYDDLLQILPQLSQKVKNSQAVKKWKSNTTYNVNDLLSYNGVIYKVVNAFTSGNTFSDADLEPASASSLTQAEVQAIINAWGGGSSSGGGGASP